MKRADPVALRKAMELARHFVRLGIEFVPMPTLDDADRAELVAQAHQRMDKLEESEKV